MILPTRLYIFLLSSIPLRRLILLLFDGLSILLSIWLSFWLRLAEPYHQNFRENIIILPISLFIGLSIYASTGQYRSLTRFAGLKSVYNLAMRNTFVVLFLAFFSLISGLYTPPRTSWFLIWVLLIFFSSFHRFLLRDLLLYNWTKSSARQPVAIFGAGRAGASLLSSLNQSKRHIPIYFIDDDSTLWGREIEGIPVLSLDFFLKASQDIRQVFISIPSLPRKRLRELVAALLDKSIAVFFVPTIDDITTGRSSFNFAKPVPIEELLGRETVDPIPSLLYPSITDLCVCVTGAAGSIGSELCRQILFLKPSKLLIIDNHEPSLYLLHQELNSVNESSVVIVPVLLNVCNSRQLAGYLSNHSVTTLFHAAAYKHVPIVESNPISGLLNNIQSTLSVCQSSVIASVKSVMLISSDKAVRPTNIMGASKRISELVFMSYSSIFVAAHNFSIVRFGNVLGSSGSVVPLFRKQISMGGPITITHPDIVRYFMTISEAASLVLQSASLSSGGEVFLLDMGEPVRIVDLAEQMIKLSGHSVCNQTNPDGDISIIFTGLRPGEKLYEELLVSATSETTSHPLIFKSVESFPDPDYINRSVLALIDYLEASKLKDSLSLVSRLVPEWIPSRSYSPIRD